MTEGRATLGKVCFRFESEAISGGKNCNRRQRKYPGEDVSFRSNLEYGKTQLFVDVGLVSESSNDEAGELEQHVIPGTAGIRIRT